MADTLYRWDHRTDDLSSSGESDSDDDENFRASTNKYLALDMKHGLNDELLFPAACQTLKLLFEQAWWDKGARKKIVEDIFYAGDTPHTSQFCHKALQKLVQSATPRLKQNEGRRLQRLYKEREIKLRRGKSDGSNNNTTDEQCPDFSTLPAECLDIIASHLQINPVHLARAACVSKAFRTACCANERWEDALALIYTSLQNIFLPPLLNGNIIPGAYKHFQQRNNWEQLYMRWHACHFFDRRTPSIGWMNDVDRMEILREQKWHDENKHTTPRPREILTPIQGAHFIAYINRLPHHDNGAGTSKKL